MGEESAKVRQKNRQITREKERNLVLTKSETELHRGEKMTDLVRKREREREREREPNRETYRDTKIEKEMLMDI